MEKKLNEIRALSIGLLGDHDSGKTAICNTLIGVEFIEGSGLTTIGTEKYEKKINLRNGKEIKLIFWDTSGQERFRSAAYKTIKRVQGIILVFDVRNKTTFDDINIFLDEIKDNFSNPALVLLGNKIDKEKEKWEVTQEEINSLVKQKI